MLLRHICTSKFKKNRLKINNSESLTQFVLSITEKALVNIEKDLSINMNNYYVSIFLNNHTFKQHGSLAPVIFPRALFILLSIFHISQNLSLEQISVKLPFVGEDEKARETQA